MRVQRLNARRPCGPVQVVHVEMVRAYGELLELVMRRGRLLQELKVRLQGFAPRLARSRALALARWRGGRQAGQSRQRRACSDGMQPVGPPRHKAGSQGARRKCGRLLTTPLPHL